MTDKMKAGMKKEAMGYFAKIFFVVVFGFSKLHFIDHLAYFALRSMLFICHASGKLKVLSAKTMIVVWAVHVIITVMYIHEMQGLAFEFCKSCIQQYKVPVYSMIHIHHTCT